MHGIDLCIASNTFIYLRLTGIQEGLETHVIGVAPIIDHRVNQVGRRDDGSVREVRSIPDIKRDRMGNVVLAVPQGGVGHNQINVGNGRVAEHEVTVSVGGVAIQIERPIGDVANPLNENDHHIIERRIAYSAIEQLDEFQRVRRSGGVGVNLIDDQGVRSRRGGRRTCRRRARRGRW
ncbi:MAG: hypothetical protein HYR88_08765 [Verrucomicrobia bacterium]|nr:hypothetical protein [Verrucomicrobiota bacterium]